RAFQTSQILRVHEKPESERAVLEIGDLVAPDQAAPIHDFPAEKGIGVGKKDEIESLIAEDRCKYSCARQKLGRSPVGPNEMATSTSLSTPGGGSSVACEPKSTTVRRPSSLLAASSPCASKHTV